MLSIGGAACMRGTAKHPSVCTKESTTEGESTGPGEKQMFDLFCSKKLLRPLPRRGNHRVIRSIFEISAWPTHTIKKINLEGMI